MLLNREEIAALIKRKQLVKNYIDLTTQLTPNGLDLTVAAVISLEGAGALDFSNKERRLPPEKMIIAKKAKKKDRFGWWALEKGAYKIRTNETINLSADLVALAFSRTSLLRMGAFTQHGVWDAGFHGEGEFILVVENPNGIRLKENARIAQLVFIKINKTKEGYRGIYLSKK